MNIDTAAQEKIEELRAERDYWMDCSIDLQEDVWALEEALKAAKAQIEGLLMDRRYPDLQVG